MTLADGMHDKRLLLQQRDVQVKPTLTCGAGEVPGRPRALGRLRSTSHHQRVWRTAHPNQRAPHDAVPGIPCLCSYGTIIERFSSSRTVPWMRQVASWGNRS